MFSLETSDGLRARSAAAAAERDVGLRPASAPQPQPSNPRFHPARTLATLFRHTRIFSQLYVFRLTARFHSRAPSRDASLLQTLQPDARGLYPSAGHPDVPQPPRPALRGGVRREGDAPRGGGTTLEVSICLFLSGNTSCSCLTAVAAALFVAVDYALRLTKTATKTAISSEWRGGGGGGGDLFLTAVRAPAPATRGSGAQRDTAEQIPRDTPSFPSSFGMKTFVCTSAGL